MSDHVKECVVPANVEEYIKDSIQTFLVDPPDTDAQWGYLSALLVVAKEALGQQMDMSPFAEAHELWKNYELVGNPWDEEQAA
jgi:hypothetical protein